MCEINEHFKNNNPQFVYQNKIKKLKQIIKDLLHLSK